jgi:hypothetical protein
MLRNTRTLSGSSLYGKHMHPLKSIDKMPNDPNDAPSLSPVGDPSRPDCILLTDAHAFRRLFTGRFMRRSPGRVRRMGLLDEFLHRSSLLKVKADMARGFDVSVALYPVAMDLAAWGIVVDRVGRVFEAKPEEGGFVELAYQGGCCRTRKDWISLVGSRQHDEENNIRLFFNKLRAMVAGRITLAGTMGFGLWDALWMSFDMASARHTLSHDPSFASRVFLLWKEFHMSAVSAMLDAGIKLIFFRESPRGFPPSEEVASAIDPYVREYLLDLTGAVQARGGRIFLDCDANEMLETDYPLKWGFDGIGPMLFRDEEDLLLARKSLSDELILVGSTAFPKRVQVWQDRPSSAGPAEFIAGETDRSCPSEFVCPDKDIHLAS